MPFYLITFCVNTQVIIHSFIHSGHFYSAPSSPLPFRGAPDYSTDTVSEFHAEAHRQLQVFRYIVSRSALESLIDDFIRVILSVSFYPCHFIRAIWSVPFCPIPFCPITDSGNILGISEEDNSGYCG